MSGWMIVAIVAIVMSGLVRIFRGHPPLPRGDSLMTPPADDGEKAAMRHEIEHLHERSRVLERIAPAANTTQAREPRRVADEIEALRDR